jgi:L-galactono-1,4-lactone dehydrogenase
MPPNPGLVAGVVVGGGTLASAYAYDYFTGKNKYPDHVEVERDAQITNWSHTRSADVSEVFAPETVEQVQEVVQWAHQSGHKLRPVGSALSPNGIANEPHGMISLANLDNILEVDEKNLTVRVQAGARIQSILEELQKHDMTLENFSSITEQQAGGWTQVSAHGTGVHLRTVDEMVTELEIVTPGLGVLRLGDYSTGAEAEMFKTARVGMGTLGVVTELTLKCVPIFHLKETVSISTLPELRKNKDELLRKHRHLRLWFLPYTDTVAVYTIDPVDKNHKVANPQRPVEESLKPMTDLLRELNPNCGDLTDQPMPLIRDSLIAVDPLNPDHLAKVNAAEAEFWKLSVGERMGESNDILGLNCGG